MNLIIVFGLVFGNVSFAQQPDYQSINEQVAQKKIEEKKQRVEKRRIKKERFKTQVNEFTSAVTPAGFLKLDQPKRSLTRTEKAQVKVIACAIRMVEKGYGGYQAPALATSILEPLVTSFSTAQEFSIAEKQLELCKEEMSKLKRLKKYDSEKMSKAVWNLADKADKRGELRSNFKMVLLMDSFVNPTVKGCVIRGLTLDAAIALHVGAGVNLVRCLMSDGAVKNYIGPVGKIGFGLGLALSFSNHDLKDYKVSRGGIVKTAAINGNATRFGEFMDSGEINYAVILGTDTNSNPSGKHNLNLGAGLFVEHAGSVGFRVFNGKRRWDLVLDSFKK